MAVIGRIIPPTQQWYTHPNPWNQWICYLTWSYGLNCVLHTPDSHVEALTPICDSIWRRGPLEMIRFKWGLGGGAFMMRLVSLWEEIRELAVCLSFSAMWGHSEKVAVCKPGREPSPEPFHDGTLNLDFQPPELWEDKFLLFCYPVYGILL